LKHKKLFQEVKDQYFDVGFYQTMKKDFPSLNGVIEPNDGQIYLAGVLCNYLIENALDKCELRRIIQFINHSFQEGGADTYQIIREEIFSEIVRYPKIRDLFLNFLNEQPRSELVEVDKRAE